MKRYFKHDAESEYGIGLAYLEFDGDWATRQVEVYGSQQFRYDDPTEVCDQPLEVTGLRAEDEITAEEFERVWARPAPEKA